MTIIVLSGNGTLTVYTYIKSLYSSAIADIPPRTYLMPVSGEQIELEDVVKLEVIVC